MAKIIKLQVDNFKRLVAVEITPDGHLVTITGPNGAGKSSVLDAIQAALGGAKALPDKPIREGEGRAKVVVDTDEYTVTRRFTAGKSTLTIKNKAGSTIDGPQKLLDKLVGSIAFDPLAFSQMKDREQRDTLLEVLGLNLDAHDQKIQKLKNERATMLAEKKRADGDLEALTQTPNLPDAEISVAELSQALSKAHATNSRARQIELNYDATQKAIAGARDEIAALERKIGVWQADLKDFEKQGAQITLVDTDAIQQQINEAEGTNEKIRANKQYRAAEQRMEELAEQIHDKFEAIQEAEAAKTNAIGSVQMPVAGLGIDANGLTLDRIPFRDVNHAKRLEVSMAVAMAKNPELKVMLVNGNGLDQDSLATIAALAEGKDYQVWMEVATDEGEGFGIEIIDGMVKHEETSE
jgi:DNA repair exonuclease SbcCD ATPase subunit